ncbi:unnamed protein product [Discosporangium mesarthrocarpum]
MKRYYLQSSLCLPQSPSSPTVSLAPFGLMRSASNPATVWCGSIHTSPNTSSPHQSCVTGRIHRKRLSTCHSCNRLQRRQSGKLNLRKSRQGYNTLRCTLVSEVTSRPTLM